MLFHIDMDEAAFLHERKKLEAQYLTLFPDEKERREYITKLLEEKYPPTRGVAILLKSMFDELETIGEARNETK